MNYKIYFHILGILSYLIIIFEFIIIHFYTFHILQMRSFNYCYYYYYQVYSHQILQIQAQIFKDYQVLFYDLIFKIHCKIIKKILKILKSFHLVLNNQTIDQILNNLKLLILAFIPQLLSLIFFHQQILTLHPIIIHLIINMIKLKLYLIGQVEINFLNFLKHSFNLEQF